MTTPNRMIGAGATLAYATTKGGSYTALTGLKNFTPPAPKRAVIKNQDLSTVSAVSGATSTPIITTQAGRAEPGDLPLTLYFDKAQYATVMGFLYTGTEYWWKASCPTISGESTPTYVKVPGWVKEVKIDEISIEDDNIVLVPIVLQLNDFPEITQGA